jgi:hypothetical protein
MEGVLMFISQLLLVAVFIFVFILGIRLLRPLHINRYRKWSTLLFKISYLVYLAILFVVLYYILYYNDSLYYNDEQPAISVLIMMINFVVPNMAIFIRRQFKKRIIYNYIFSTVNVFFVVYMAQLLWNTIF